MALSEKEITLLREVVSLPAAPFCELAVQDYVRNWSKNNNFDCIEDKVGNLLIGTPQQIRSWSGSGLASGKNSNPAKVSAKAPWVLQAHMDHPGFELIACKGTTAKAWFRGGVDKKYFTGSKMIFIPVADTGIAPVRGVVKSAVKDKATGFLICSIRLQKAVEMPARTLGMWDLNVWKQNNNNLSLRAADDLGGAAAVLLTLSRLKSRRAKRMPMGLLTRAEETGFVGAVAACKSGLVKKDCPIIGIETSKAQPAAPLGKGAVIRLGDKMSMFEPGLTMVLRRVADNVLASRSNKILAKKGDGFAYNAALMPGGSTESTLMALMGYHTCAVCLPLGNYHNMGTDKIAPEKITISDMSSLVELLAAVSQEVVSFDAENKLKDRLMKNYQKRKMFL